MYALIAACNALGRAMGSTLDLLLCEECEEALDLIDP